MDHEDRINFLTDELKHMTDPTRISVFNDMLTEARAALEVERSDRMQQRRDKAIKALPNAKVIVETYCALLEKLNIHSVKILFNDFKDLLVINHDDPYMVPRDIFVDVILCFIPKGYAAEDNYGNVVIYHDKDEDDH